MNELKKSVLAAVLCLPFSVSTKAAAYQVTVMGDAANFIGCLAINEATGVGFIAVGDTVALLGTSKELKVNQGDAVAGSWSVDGGDVTTFASKANSANTVTIDVPNDAVAVAALTTGKVLTVKTGGNLAKFDLDGSTGAFVNLVSCMTTKTAP